MQFLCKREALCSAVSQVMRGVSPKAVNPALEGICIRMEQNAVVLTGYDLEIGIRTRIEAECTQPFTFVVNARLFSEMTRRMTGEDICLAIDENLNAVLSSDDTKCRITAMSAEEFPALPVVESMTKTAIPQPVLRSMIMQSHFAASTKVDKPIMTGLLFEADHDDFYVVAMDRYRLALRQEHVPGIGTFRYVVPKKALMELVGMLKDDQEAICEFSTNGKHIVFSANGFELFARLLEGQFHNFRSSIPSDCKTTVTTNTKDILGCAERCSLFINDKHKAPMRCTFGDDAMQIFCKTGIGEIDDKIPCEIEGEGVTIGMSNRYVMEALRVCEGDRIKLHMSGCNKVVKITPLEGESFVYLIMPIQLKN